MTAERVEVYRYVPLLGQPIPMGVQPFLVYDSIPEDEEINWAVHRLRRNHLGGPSVERSEQLRQWLRESTRGNTPAATNWQKVLAIVHSELRDGIISK